MSTLNITARQKERAAACIARFLPGRLGRTLRAIAVDYRTLANVNEKAFFAGEGADGLAYTRGVRESVATMLEQK